MFKNPALKVVATFAVFTVLSVLMHLNKSQAAKPLPSVKHQPSLPYIVLQPTPYRVMIKSWGQLEPSEQTRLSSQVSGKVDFVAKSFEPGSIVHKGELLFSLDSADFKSEVIRAQAELASRKANLSKEYAQVEVAKEQWRNVAQSPTDLALRKPQLAAAKALVTAAEEQLRVAKRDLERSKVYAPFNGVVVSRTLGVGQIVLSAQEVALIYNADEAKVVAPVAHFDLPYLPKGIIEGVKVYDSLTKRQALDNPGNRLKGTVVGRMGLVETKTRMNQLLVKIADPYGLNRSGQGNDHFEGIAYGSYVALEIPGIELDEVFRIPQHLLSDDKVWIIDDGQKLKKVGVEVMREQDDVVYVRQGLHRGDKLVTQLPEFPQQGMAVEGFPSETKTALSQTYSGRARL